MLLFLCCSYVLGQNINNENKNNNIQANVVCHQLGFPNGAISAPCCSSYGQVPSGFSYDEVQCLGSEVTLDSCLHANNHDCGPFEGAGIVCNPETGTILNYFLLVGKNCLM